ncbi:flavin monoamine oxidase family protein [Agaribacterium sp. ZY112]|uniref:flavin monoamine oxidase family protein n=1 Tax=Agaribacterium sp. ZY112 TaxID=3233574 RepID=UPI0035255BAF
MKPGITHNLKTISSDPDNWIPKFPNPADFRFDYFKLLQESPNGLATVHGDAPTVAIVGAGAAGMTTARELLRCGYHVTIYEASGRIGGRLFTTKNPLDTQGGGADNLDHAGMELGAMRMPFFSKPEDDNSILGYYLNSEAGDNKAILTPFPNPGAAPGNTGIYINEGYGPQGAQTDSPSLISWPEESPPDNVVLQELNKKVNEFGAKFSIPAHTYYTHNNENWLICWNKMVAHYETMTFNDLVLAEAMSVEEITQSIKDPLTFNGNVGGFGMSAEQASLLYTIGTGDGSWGAFYSISSLWFLRCTFFGFDSNLQTVEGLTSPSSLPFFNESVYDSSSKPLAPPIYEGIQSLVEYLYYTDIPGDSKKSLHADSKLYVSCPISKIEKNPNGGVLVYSPQYPNGQQYDQVVVSSTQWAAQMSIEFSGFSETQLPDAKITTSHTQHNISSCKLFFPLTGQYWNKNNYPDCKIPQIIVTDTFVQDLYGLAWDSKPDDKGILLASYTWEDDSLKLLPYEEDRLAELVLAELRNITMSTVGQDITQYIDSNFPVTIQWIKEPTYIGCSKLYRAHNEADNMLDLSYNQCYSSASDLYFAGENYGVEGGWTEPALRSAMDCVIHMLNNNSNATFNCASFNFDRDYPSWPVTVFADVAWQKTGVSIPAGATAQVFYISGEWTDNPNENGGALYGPTGTPLETPAQPGYTLPGANEGALVGRVNGGDAFLIGDGTTLPAGLSGELELCINDDLLGQYGAGLTDNQGSIMMQVYITPA